MNPWAQGRPITFKVARLVSRRQGPIGLCFFMFVHGLCTRVGSVSLYNTFGCQTPWSHVYELSLTARVYAFVLSVSGIPPYTKRVCRSPRFHAILHAILAKKLVLHRCSNLRGDTYNTTTSRFLMIYQLEYVKRVHAELIQSDTLD